MLLTSSSDRCSGLRWPAVSLRRDVVSSLSTVESEQMGGSGTKVRWGREGPCTPSTGITDSREALLAVGRTSVSSDPSVSFEGDWVVVPGRGWRIRGCFGNFKIWVFTCQGRRAGLVCFLIRIFLLDLISLRPVCIVREHWVRAQKEREGAKSHFWLSRTCPMHALLYLCLKTTQ